MNDTQIYILYTCDQWKTRESVRLLMVSTKFERILEQLRTEIAREDDAMIYAGVEGDNRVAVFDSASAQYHQEIHNGNCTIEKAVDQINGTLQLDT